MIVNDERREGFFHQHGILGRGKIGIHAFHFAPKQAADIHFHDFEAVRL